jgi:hypothetical protein
MPKWRSSSPPTKKRRWRLTDSVAERFEEDVGIELTWMAAERETIPQPPSDGAARYRPILLKNSSREKLPCFSAW